MTGDDVAPASRQLVRRMRTNGGAVSAHTGAVVACTGAVTVARSMEQRAEVGARARVRGHVRGRARAGGSGSSPAGHPTSRSSRAL